MNSRFRIFLSFALTIIFCLYFYLGLRLASGAPAWLGLSIPFLFIFSYAFLIRGRVRTGSFGAYLITEGAYLSMGLLSFLLVMSLARDLVGLLSGYWMQPLTAVGIALLSLGIAALRGIFGPSVRRRDLFYKELPAELEGFRIVHISDLHIGPSIGVRYVEKVVRKTVALEPQLLAFTGDIGDGPVQNFREELRALARVAEAKAPIFYVPGNHEAYWSFHSWAREFRAIGFRVLLNEGQKEGAFHVSGITDPAFEQMGVGEAPDLARAAAEAGKEFKILLSHRPGYAEEAERHGFHLQLSGHTHGGQFFPWTIVASLVHRYNRGAYQIKNMWVYVSMGTGSWVPRLRLGTTAEIAVLTLRRG